MAVLLSLVLLLCGCLRGVWTLECETGQYSENDECRMCPTQCSRCMSDVICTICKPGFYGSSCSQKCSESCANGICLQENGQCVSCRGGHYYSSNKTCAKCPEHCIYCQSQSVCTSCKMGFTGTACQEECTNCNPVSGCNIETKICTAGCIDGYTGPTCIERCALNCKSCDPVNAGNCRSCAVGRYGQNCDAPCSTKCKDQSCNENNGFCTHGCEMGFWGNQCEINCSKNCLESFCYKSNGTCSKGCYGNFTGYKCLCPSKCECELDGTCKKCSKESGFTCDKPCSSACVGNICSTDNKLRCLYGCREGEIHSLCSQEEGGVPSYAFYVPTIVIVFCLVVAITGGGIWRIRRKRREQDSLDSIQPEFKNLLQGESDNMNEDATSNKPTKFHARDQNTKSSHDKEAPVPAKSVSCNTEPVAVQSKVPGGGDQRKADRTKMKQPNKDSQSSKEKIIQSSMPLTESVTHTKPIAGQSEVGGDQRNLDRNNMKQTNTDQNDVEKKTSELLTKIKAGSVLSETKLESEKTEVHGDQRNTERNKKTQPNKYLQCVEHHVIHTPSYSSKGFKQITGVSSYTEPVVEQNKVPDVQRKADRNMTKQPNENPQSVEKKISKPLGLMNLIVSKIKPSKDDRGELKSWQQKLKDIANHLETKDEEDIRKEFSSFPATIRGTLLKLHTEIEDN